MDLIVGMGEYKVSNRADDILRTFSLATCVAVTVYSPLKKAAGMIHVVLPFPFDRKDRAERPGYFAETGVPLLINTVCRTYGCKQEELLIQIYGGADSRLEQDIYNVGKKNIDAVKAALIGMGLTIVKADLRGKESRTVSMEVKTGRVEIHRRPI
ncbi:CheD [Syntrophobotulus glycolicus DSM 8271]|uniref:CheD n=1 Tax=Syntrophobotulus glycolicus (strain DSM 8271 / FlGlyR) TaxID=645991 RepID=F0SUK4_SYNGF|nr:chemotaxis protein CheD [Syntrophobotulus glycolicus]ADY55497.1 CheD [Syntrophobotulus glycolicus DSM 8271]